MWPNILSLDAPLLALVWLAAFAHAAQSTVPSAAWTMLALVVWLIYAADRWLDTTRIGEPTEVTTARHGFTARHRRAILIMMLVATLGIVLAAFSLPGWAWSWAIAPSALTLAYAGWFRRSRLVPKEIACGLVFALGVTCPVQRHFTPDLWLVTAAFGLLCTANCLVIGSAERHHDARHDPAAASRSAPVLLSLLPVFLILLILSPLGMHLKPLSVAIAASAAALLALMLAEERLSPRLIRVLADAALLTPLPLLLH